MKKRICGFRQKLGIILAAGMIVSNMNFAVLPVSATDGVENPPVGGAFSADAVLEMLELIDRVNQLPSPEQITDAEAAQEDFNGIWKQFNSITEEQVLLMTEEQKLSYEAAETKLNDLGNYFSPITESEIATTTEGNDDTSRALSEEDAAAIVKTVTDYLAGEIKKVAAGTQESTQFDVFHLLSTSSDIEAAYKALGTKASEIANSLLITCQNDLFWYDKSAENAFFVSQNLNPDGTGSVLFGFRVLPEYQKAGNQYAVDTTKINSANTALNKAQEIVNANAGKSDYEKLLAVTIHSRFKPKAYPLEILSTNITRKFLFRKSLKQ